MLSQYRLHCRGRRLRRFANILRVLVGEPVNPPPRLIPLVLRTESPQLAFTLDRSGEIIEELPPDYERVLGSLLAPHLGAAPSAVVTVDLQNAPAISSRELGALIALQKVARVHGRHVALLGVSPGVRHLLQLTRTDQLFETVG